MGSAWHADVADGSARPADGDRGLGGLGGADALQDVGRATPGQLAHLVGGAEAAGHVEPCVVAAHDDDAVGPQA